MQIVETLRALRRAEHESTVEIVASLVSLYESRAYLELGYGSIWDFLVRELNYSAGAASRRYKAMQCARRFPVVLDMLRGHRTSLCALAKAEATLATASNAEELLGLIDGKSAREVEQVVAREKSVPPKRERVRRVIVQPAATIFEQEAPREERVWISFTITPEQTVLLEQAKAKMSAKLGGGPSCRRSSRSCCRPISSPRSIGSWRSSRPSAASPQPCARRSIVAMAVAVPSSRRMGGAAARPISCRSTTSGRGRWAGPASCPTCDCSARSTIGIWRGRASGQFQRGSQADLHWDRRHEASTDRFAVRACGHRHDLACGEGWKRRLDDDPGVAECSGGRALQFISVDRRAGAHVAVAVRLRQ